MRELFQILEFGGTLCTSVHNTGIIEVTNSNSSESRRYSLNPGNEIIYNTEFL
jgi:hypothetical protein